MSSSSSSSVLFCFGPRSPQTTRSVDHIPFLSLDPWNNTDNAKTEDDTYSHTNSLSSSGTERFVAENFNFDDVPDDSVPSAVFVEVQIHSGNGGNINGQVWLWYNGDVIGFRKFAFSNVSAGDDDTYELIGGDLWGTVGLTTAQIKSGLFGCAFTTQAGLFDPVSVDHVRMTVCVDETVSSSSSSSSVSSSSISSSSISSVSSSSSAAIFDFPDSKAISIVGPAFAGVTDP